MIPAHAREAAGAASHPRPATVRERFCSACGYGVVVREDPPSCPMCRASAWRDRALRSRWN